MEKSVKMELAFSKNIIMVMVLAGFLLHVLVQQEMFV